MNCLVVAATAMEIAPLVSHYGSAQNRLTGIDILVTGVGLTATTYSLTSQLSLKRPDLVIQAGLGGCFDKDKKLGTVFVVSNELIADMGVIESKNWATVFELGLAKQNAYPFKSGRLANKNPILGKVKLPKVMGISVNEITTSRQKINVYKKKFDPVVESMEGAAFHYVCLMEKIPFLQLRAASNYAGERNKKNWKIQESISNLNQELLRLLYSL
jgi:futalosine hydrolase